MKAIKIGIFGLGRGSDYFEHFTANGGEIVAVCDRNEQKLEETRSKLGETLATYTDFDAFLNHEGMEAVYVSNVFHEHAPYAVRCLEKGIHVLSECLSNATMAEGVALVRAAEKSHAVYMLAENYPYMIYNREMKRVFEGGTLGDLLFAEGEYNHPIDGTQPSLIRWLRPYEKHWRNFLPTSYYITHSLAPLMYITGATPATVTAFAVFNPANKPDDFFRGAHVGDRLSMITCQNTDGSVFRMCGWGQFGAHGNAYRVCGTKGQVENMRSMPHRILLRYNDWEVPEGRDVYTSYDPEWFDLDADNLPKAGHGICDYLVIKEFFDCIREGKTPTFDVYASTTMSSVAILAHRSALEGGKPYTLPDFRREADRVAYENDDLTPFWGSDGTPPNFPCCSRPDYKPSPEEIETYLAALDERNDPR